MDKKRKESQSKGLNVDFSSFMSTTSQLNGGGNMEINTKSKFRGQKLPKLTKQQEEVHSSREQYGDDFITKMDDMDISEMTL